MFLFGGNNYHNTVSVQNPHDDNSEAVYTPLYALNLKTFQWTQLKTRGDQVPPRDEHTAVLDETNYQMAIFGGFQQGERTNEVAIFNLKLFVW